MNNVSKLIEPTDVVCDKLSVTLHVQADEENAILANLEEASEAGFARRSHKVSYYYKAFEFGLGEDAKEIFLVQCGPRHAGASFLRVEFNPAKSPLGEVQEFTDLILAGGFQRLVEFGKCTRVDATVDLQNVHISELLVWKSNISKSSSYFKGPNPETYYLGSSDSPKRLCIYDKVAEIKQRNKKKLFKDSLPEIPITRIESRHTAGLPMSALANLPNPFAGVGLAHFPVSQPTDELFRVFLVAARAEGGTAALLALDPPTRKQFKERLHNASPSWWSPGKIWETWPTMAQTILTIQPKPYSLYVSSKSTCVDAINCTT